MKYAIVQYNCVCAVYATRPKIVETSGVSVEEIDDTVEQGMHKIDGRWQHSDHALEANALLSRASDR